MSSGGGHPLFGFVPPTALSGGTGPTTTTASLLWGPRFGKSDDATFRARQALAFKDLKLTGQNQIQVAQALDKITLNYQNVGVHGALSTDQVAMSSSQGVAAGFPFDYRYRVENYEDQEDTWVDEENPDTNYGADNSMFCRQDSVLGGTAQRAYAAWDFTGFPGVGTGLVIDSATFTFQVRRVDGLLDANLNFEIYTVGSKPFEEDTATWNNPPTDGTLRESGSFDSLGTSFVTRSFTLDEATTRQALGQWIQFVFIGETGIGNTTQFEIRTQEALSGRPSMDDMEIQVD